MDLLNSLMLGILQGFTEFLPVSSSGHLVLAEHLLGFKEAGVAFEVTVHLGTLLAVITVFYKDLLRLIQTFFDLFKPRFYTVGLMEQYRRNADLRLMIFLIAASIPAAIVGLAFEDRIEAAFGDPRLTSLMLIVTAAVLALTALFRNRNRSLNLGNTFLMGVAQAVAVLPGISRSGSTISAGLYQGVDSNEAARFSFLLAVPAVLGAVLLQLVRVIQNGLGGLTPLVLIVGLVSAYLSGLLAIRSLLAVVRRGKLYWFAPYCLLMGILGHLFL